MKTFFDSAIKLNELYGAVEKHSKVHIQNFDEKRVETSLSLFNPSCTFESTGRFCEPSHYGCVQYSSSDVPMITDSRPFERKMRMNISLY